MSRFYNALRDVQQDEPVGNCPACKGGEIYRYDEVADINGRLVHENCMTAEEREDYPTHPVCNYFEEGY